MKETALSSAIDIDSRALFTCFLRVREFAVYDHTK